MPHKYTREIVVYIWKFKKIMGLFPSGHWGYAAVQLRNVPDVPVGANGNQMGVRPHPRGVAGGVFRRHMGRLARWRIGVFDTDALATGRAA